MVKDLKRFYDLQRRTTRYAASIIVRHGPDTVLEWLKIHVDEKAPTPATFRAKEKAFVNSPLYVKRDHCE